MISNNDNKKSPLIGILPILSKNSEEKITEMRQARLQKFIEAIDKFGGEVLLLNYESDIPQVLKNIDGWLIPGGPDIHPEFYNEKKIHEKTNLHDFTTIKSSFEKQLYELAPKNLPILGVCYGMQILNCIEGNLNRNA